MQKEGSGYQAGCKKESVSFGIKRINELNMTGSKRVTGKGEEGKSRNLSDEGRAKQMEDSEADREVYVRVSIAHRVVSQNSLVGSDKGAD